MPSSWWDLPTQASREQGDMDREQAGKRVACNVGTAHRLDGAGDDHRQPAERPRVATPRLGLADAPTSCRAAWRRPPTSRGCGGMS